MLELLVVDDNIFFAKTLINMVVKDNPNLRLCMIATNGKEAIEILKNKKIDIVLLDLKLPDYSGLDILEFIEKEQKDMYYNSIIVISGELEMISKVVDNPLLYSYIVKGTGIDKIINTINELCEYKKEKLSCSQQKKKSSLILKKQIYEELYKIGYNIHFDGTKYLMETIYYLHCKGHKGNYKLEKEIYPIIARKYSKKTNTIKSDVIKATNKRDYKNKEKEIKMYFSYFIDSKVSPKIVINTILNKLEHKYF